MSPAPVSGEPKTVVPRLFACSDERLACDPAHLSRESSISCSTNRLAARAAGKTLAGVDVR